MSLSLRARYFALGVVVMLVGLIVHFQGARLSANARDIIGDALWATLIASFVSVILPWRRPWQRYFTALIIFYAVELSQLSQLSALQYVRSTLLGRLVLGSGFDPRDLAAYALGIIGFIALDQCWVLRKNGERV